MIPKILNFEEMVSLYIKILKKTITDTELELLNIIWTFLVACHMLYFLI